MPDSVHAPPPAGPSRAVRLFRLYAALAFSFAWVPVMYTAFTRDRGFTPSQYMQLWSVYYLTMVVAELPWGWVADRIGTRPLLVAGPFALALGFLVLGHADSHLACLLAMAATGAAHAMISGADSAYLYEIVVAEGRRVQALREESKAHLARLLGVSMADLVGGFVAFSLGTAAAFDLSAGLLAAAGLVAWRLPRVPASVRRSRPSLALAVRTLGQPGVLWICAWYTAVFVLLRIGFQLYQPTLLAADTHDLRLHGGTLCVLNLVAGLATLLVARTRLRLRERGTACLVLLLLTVSFGGLTFFSTGLAVLAPLLCLQQVSFGFLQPLGRTALNHRIPSGERASLLSAQSMLARLAFGLTLHIASWDLALDVHLDRTYALLAGVAVLMTVLLFATHRGEPDGET